MAVGNPGFGAEIFKIEPARRGAACCHGLQVGGRQIAGEGFDDDIGRGCRRKLCWPVADSDAFLLLPGSVCHERRAQRSQGGRLVNPESHTLAVDAHQLSRQAPADAGIAIIVDDAAENVPSLEWGVGALHGGRC